MARAPQFFLRKIKTNQHLLSEKEILNFVEDIEKKAAEIKKSVNTGDDDSDFDNGLQQLHKYSQRK